MEEHTRLIPLTQGKFAIVDAADYELLSQYKWRYSVYRYGHEYAVRSETIAPKKQRTVFMHRFLLDAEKGTDVDHKNGDGLDNRRQNLRVCSHQQNLQNMKPKGGSSVYKGVSWDKRLNKWRVHIRVNGKSMHVRMFVDELAAAKAYDAAALANFGEYARRNL